MAPTPPSLLFDDYFAGIIWPEYDLQNDSDFISPPQNQAQEKGEPMPVLDYQEPKKVESKRKGARRSKRTKTFVSGREYVPQTRLAYPRWSRIEDVFLTGLVMDTYLRRHSLKPFQSEKDRMKELMGSDCSETPVWFDIHRRYTIACRRWEILNGATMGNRTVRALQKRWKIGDSTHDHEVDDEGNFTQLVPDSAPLYTDWLTVYNKDLLLTCPEPVFRQHFEEDFDHLLKDTPDEKQIIKRRKLEN